jgi:hypothetical protein
MLTCALLVDACSNHDPEEKDFSDVITESFRSVTKEEKLELTNPDKFYNFFCRTERTQSVSICNR